MVLSKRKDEFMTILIKKNFYEKSVRDFDAFIEATDKKIEETSSRTPKEVRREIRDNFVNAPLAYLD